MARINRRTFVIGSAAAGAAWTVGAGRLTRASGALRTTPPAARPAVRGVNFDTDRETWIPDFVPHEMATIANDLHANSVLLLGHDVDRLVVAATAAADAGLGVWFEARQFDADAAATLDFLSAVAVEAEALRREHPDVALSVGCELTIFMGGLVPGSNYEERAAALTDPAEWNQALNGFLAQAVATSRPLFGGQLTYSSGEWEDVAWDDFDVVGVDLYRDQNNRDVYAEHVRGLHRHGKPVVITEFGCCAFTGADDLGGLGFSVVDYSVSPPVIPAQYERDEGVQAREIDAVIDILEAEGVHGLFIYDFITPDAPHIPEYPQFDYDKASFALVKCHPEGPRESYASTGYFEPRLAFDVVAGRFGDA